MIRGIIIMYRLTRRKSIFLGTILIFAGMFIRSYSFSNGNYFGTAIAILVLSVGVGFAFAGLFSNDLVTSSQVKKYMMVPLTIALVIIAFDKLHINMPILQVLILFFINILFFRNEIKKAIKG